MSAARHIALLRAVNVSAGSKVATPALKRLAEDLGFGRVETWLATGNLVFDAEGTPDEVEQRLETALADRLGLATDVFVRTAAEWRAALAANPFPAAAGADPSHLLVLALKTVPTPEAIEALRAAIVGRETVAAQGRQLYAVFPDGIGRSKLTPMLIERKLGTRATGRNWNTASKLAAMADA